MTPRLVRLDRHSITPIDGLHAINKTDKIWRAEHGSVQPKKDSLHATNKPDEIWAAKHGSGKTKILIASLPQKVVVLQIEPLCKLTTTGGSPPN